jgi:uncharacterized protein involved in type VI secretion and phage assembly
MVSDMDLGLYQAQEEHYYGKYRGKVTRNDDDRHQGRIKARVPEVLGDIETNWALPCSPYAGDGMGQFAIPPVEAGVWIEFEAGDVSRPIWSGCWWGENKVPRKNDGAMADPSVKIIQSDEKMMIAFDDSTKTIHISDKNGSNMLEIKLGQGTATLKGATKVVIETPQIELVKSSTHPLVFGDDLLQYLIQIAAQFNAHTHPAELALGIFPITPAPPVPFFTAATPSMLSTKVKTG